MSHTRFRVSLHSVVAWMSRSSLLEIGAVSDIEVTAEENQSHDHLVRKQTLNYLAPLETHKIHLLFSWKRWTSTKIGR